MRIAPCLPHELSFEDMAALVFMPAPAYGSRVNADARNTQALSPVAAFMTAFDPRGGQALTGAR
jgi:hypothetical protein